MLLICNMMGYGEAGVLEQGAQISHLDAHAGEIMRTCIHKRGSVK